MEIRKLLLLGMLFFGGCRTLLSAEDSEAGPAQAEKMVTIQTSDHTEANPKLFKMPLSQAKKMHGVKNLFEDFGEERYLVGPGKEDLVRELIPLVKVDSELFTLIKTLIEQVAAVELAAERATKERVAELVHTIFGEQHRNKALQEQLNVWINIGQAADFLELHLVEGEVTDSEKHEWAMEIFAEKVAFFLQSHGAAFLEGVLQFPEETADNGGFFLKVKELLLQRVSKWMVQELRGQMGIVRSLCVDAEGTLYAGSDDYTIRVWRKNADGRYEEQQVLRGHEDVVGRLCLDGDGTLYSGSGDGTIRVWRKNADGLYGEQEVLRGHRSWINGLAILPDGTLYSNSGDGTIRVWRKGADGRYGEPEVLRGNIYFLGALAILSDGTLYSNLDYRTIGVWSKGVDGRYGEPQVLEGHEDAVTRLVVLPDGTLYSGSSDGTIRVWRKGADGRYGVLQVLEGHTDSISALAVLPNETVYSGSCGGAIRVWVKGADGRYGVPQVLEGHTARICALSILFDGALYSASDDRTIRVWRSWLYGYKEDLGWKQAALLLWVCQARRAPIQNSDLDTLYLTISEPIRAEIERFGQVVVAQQEPVAQ